MSWVALVALGAGLGCPLHALWRLRRGKQPGCCPPAEEEGQALARLRERQASLARSVARSSPHAHRGQGAPFRN
jgi:hypothetical protein